MKKEILKSYTFIAASKQIIFDNVDQNFGKLDSLIIQNRTVNKIIYNPLAGVLNGAVWSGNTITLASLDNTGMLNTDVLYCQYAIDEQTESDFFPQYTGQANLLTDKRMRLDGAGSLITRGGVLTDEGSYYAHFDGSSLNISSSGAVFLNGSDRIYFDYTTVDIHVNEYVKLSTDGVDKFVQIYDFGEDITGKYLTLMSNYLGTSGTGTINISVLLPKIGTGCSLTVSGGYAVLGSGTTNASVVELERDVDYLPVIKVCRLKISQRIANQEVKIGLYDEGGKYWAIFSFTGTNDRYLVCETAHVREGTPTASDKETTEVYLQQTKTTENDLELWIEINWQDIKFKIDGTVVATHKRIIFHPTDVATSTIQIINGTGTASNTNVSVYYDKVKNFNRVDIGLGDTDSLLLKTDTPRQGDTYVPVRNVPIKTYNVSFAATISNNVDTEMFTLLQTGTGNTVNQTGGNLVIVSGTTANSELVIRSKFSVAGLWRLLYSLAASARIVNNNLFVELVDVIGDGLSYTIINATTVDITIPDNFLTSINVGQGIQIGIITGAAGIPMRGVIASVTGNVVRFTVAGWPASGSGTCSLFGWNNTTIVYNGTTVTNNSFNTQRKGYQDTVSTLTIQTTNSPGHLVAINSEDNAVAVGDALAASGTGSKFTPRGDRFTNVPDKDSELFLQIRSLNGTTSPAGATTWTIGFVRLEDVVVNNTSINSIKFHGFMQSLPVAVQGSVTLGSNSSCNVAQFGGQNVVTNGTNGIPLVGLAARSNGGPSNHRLVAAGTNNATSVKNSAGTITSATLINTTAAYKYVKTYNKTTAPAPATDNGLLVQTLALPPNSVTHLQYPHPLYFSTGIAYAIVNLIADTDNTSVTANDVVVSIQYV